MIVRRARILYAMGFAADWPVNPAFPNFRAADEPLLAVPKGVPEMLLC